MWSLLLQIWWLPQEPLFEEESPLLEVINLLELEFYTFNTPHHCLMSFGQEWERRSFPTDAEILLCESLPQRFLGRGKRRGSFPNLHLRPFSGK